MKNAWWFILTVLLVSGLGWAEEQGRTISVSGTSVAKTPPDIIVWTIGVVERGPSVAAIKTDNDAKVKMLLDAIKELKVSAEDMQTSHLTAQREFEHGEQGKAVFKGWYLSRTIVFKQRDLARFDEFFAKLFSAGDVEANYTFESSKYYELRDQARLEAVRAAKKKAEAMCGELGVKLGAVKTVTEFRPEQLSSFGRATMSNGAFVSPESRTDVDAGGTMVPGLIEIRESVDVIFDIQQ
jgi:uncharacterized protein